MSKNRNLRNKIVLPTYANSNLDAVDNTEVSDDETKTKKCLNISKAYFNIFSNFCVPNNDDEMKSIVVSDYDNDDGSFVSSSSLSWGEDYEKEYTSKVGNELHLMERVLDGLEDIPSNYDEDEYKLWIKTFPNVRFNGRNKPKETFIKDKQKSVNKKPANQTKAKTNLSEDVIPHFADILQISPVPINQSKEQSNKTITKNSFGTKTNRRMKLSRDISPQFNSLPEITIDNFVSNTRQINNINNNSLSAKSRKLVDNSTRRVLSIKNKTQHIFLPPLTSQNSTYCSSSREFRSISITPRQIRNGTSAISEILPTRRYENNSNFDKLYNRSSSMHTEHPAKKHVMF